MVLSAGVVKLTLISTSLSPQFRRHVVGGLWVMECTETAVQPLGKHPTSMVRKAGFSLLATLSNESEGIGPCTALENMVGQSTPLGIVPPHSLSADGPAGNVWSTFVRKS